MSDTVSVTEATIKKNIITVSHLCKRYGAINAVDDVTFSINEGEIFGIIGPNGAGKTTTVECISGLRVPDSGSVTIYDLSPKEDREELKKFVGVQLQESSLPPRIKVLEALNLFASFYSEPLDPRELLKSLGMTEKRNAKFKQLSGGQKQRLSIALALIGNPKIAILDELTTGLDPDARREVWGLIERIRERGVTVILVTHYMDEAERLCDLATHILYALLKADITVKDVQVKSGNLEDAFVKLTQTNDKTLKPQEGQ